MKKILSFVLVISMFLCLTYNSFASNEGLSSEEKTDQQKIQDMVSDGLSYDDAKYYAQLDDMVINMEKNKQEFTLDKHTKELTDQDVASDLKGFRAKILKGDKAATKKGLESIVNLQKNVDKMQKFIDKNKGQSQYEMQFPDGSKISVKNYSAQPVLDNKVYPQGYSEGIVYDSQGLYKNDGTYTYGYFEWRFETGTSYSKVRITYSLNMSNAVATMTYAMGAQSSYGSVSIANTTGGTITRTSSSGSGTPAEVCNQVVFSVSSSFSATFKVLSIAVNAGANWTQYAYVRIYGSGNCYSVAAYYD